MQTIKLYNHNAALLLAERIAEKGNIVAIMKRGQSTLLKIKKMKR